MGGAWFRMAKSRKQSQIYSNQAHCLTFPAYPREKITRDNAYPLVRGFFHRAPAGQNPPLKLTARQESCRDMTQCESPRRLESTHCDVPVATPFPHLPKEGPTCTPAFYLWGPPCPAHSPPAKPSSDFAYAEESARRVRHAASGIARIGGVGKTTSSRGPFGACIQTPEVICKKRLVSLGFIHRYTYNT